MKRVTPLAVLLICSFIGLLTGRFGLWFPLGIAGFVIVAIARDARRPE